jgi:subtilase family serine protease
MRTAKTSLSIAAVAGALVATGLMAAPSANAAPKRHAIAHTKPTWVARAHSLGSPSSQAKTSLRVYLAPNGGTDALKAAVAKVSNPRSPSYRHFLSAKQFHARYDATTATVNKVTGYLRANDLSVTSVEAHHRYVAVEGTNAQIQKAFEVTLRKFRHAGQLVQANTGAASLPVDVAGVVTAVTGLDTTRRLLRHDTSPPPDGFRNARPCSRYYGQVSATYQADFKTKLPKFQGKTLPYAVCGYRGTQFRGAYEGANQDTLSGKGVTVAIIDAYASPTIKQDAQEYASRNGDAGYGGGQYTQVVPSSFRDQDECGENGWWGEQTLDVEAVHAMAQAANIRYYGAASCEDSAFVPVYNKLLDEDKASIISNSYGDAGEDVSTDLIAAEEQAFLQAAMQGVTFMFSSGDSGDEVAGTGTKQPDYSASDPYVTAVGGTADAIGSDNKLLAQTGWGTNKYALSGNGQSWQPAGFLYGAGGGNSSLFNKPDYQQGVVPGSYGAGRAVPDVAMDADPTTGMLIGQTQTFPDGVSYGEFRIGGTSLASPLFAGMTALASQHAGGRLGFLNPALYQQAGSSLFSDVKGAPAQPGNVRPDYVNGVDGSDGLAYSVRTFNQDSSLAVKPGWDDVTGIGSPKASWLTSLGK